MKYFTKQLWIDAQQPGKAGRAVGQRYQDAFAAYARELAMLRPRLPADVLAFFESADVHDGRLVTFRIAEVDPHVPKPTAIGTQAAAGGDNDDDSSWDRRYQLAVELSVAEWSGTQWLLRYAGIRRTLVDFPSTTPLFFSPGDGFEDWGYHELSDAGDGFLRHEVLFSSGATILVEFRDLSVTRVARPDAVPTDS